MATPSKSCLLPFADTEAAAAAAWWSNAVSDLRRIVSTGETGGETDGQLSHVLAQFESALELDFDCPDEPATPLKAFVRRPLGASLASAPIPPPAAPIRRELIGLLLQLVFPAALPGAAPYGDPALGLGCVLPSVAQSVYELLHRLLDDTVDLSAIVIPFEPLLGRVLDLADAFRRFNGVLPGRIRRAQNELLSFVTRARARFPSGATDAILAALLPLVAPAVPEADVSVAMLVRLVPSPKSAAEVEAWLPQLLACWPVNSSAWDSAMLPLLARMVRESGRDVVALDAAAPLLATRILTAIAVQVGASDSARVQTLPVSPLASFLLQGQGASDSSRTFVAAGEIFGYGLDGAAPDGGALFPLFESMLAVLRPYTHPSNVGAWSVRIGVLLTAFVSAVSVRQSRGGHSVNGVTHAPLSPPLLAAVAAALRPLLDLALYSKSDQLAAAARRCYRDLITVTPPELLALPLAESLALSLQSVTEAHRTQAALDTLGALALPLYSAELCPAIARGGLGATLLRLALPGIDANDTSKTRATLTFFNVVLTLVPLVAGSDTPLDAALGLGFDPETEDEARAAADAIAAWVLELVDALLRYCESLDGADGRGGGGGGGGGMGGMAAAVAVELFRGVATALFAQMSPAVHALAWARLWSGLTRQVLAQAGAHLAALLGSAAAASPVTVLPVVAGSLIPAILADLDAGAGVDASMPADRVLLWRIALLRGAISRLPGASLSPIVPSLVPVFARCAHVIERTLASALGDLFAETCGTLLDLRLAEARSHPPSVWESAALQAMPWRFWGTAVGDLAAVEPFWLGPGGKEYDAAAALMDAFAVPVLARLRAFIDGAEPESKDSLHRDIAWLRSVVRAASVLAGDEAPPSASEADRRMDRELLRDGNVTALASNTPVADRLNVSAGARRRHGLVERSVHWRWDIAALVHGLKDALLARRPDHSAALGECVDAARAVLKHSLGPVSSGASMLHASFMVMLMTLPGREEDRFYPRPLALSLASTLFWLRGSALNKGASTAAPFRTLLGDLYSLSLGPYASVRKAAQSALDATASRFPATRRTLIRAAIGVLASCPEAPAAAASSGAGAGAAGAGAGAGESAEEDAALTGAVYVLQDEVAHIMRRPALVAALFQALLATHSVQSHSNLARLSELFGNALDAAAPVSLRLLPGAGGAAGEAETARRCAALAAITDDVLAFVRQRPSLHWRYQNYACGMVGVLQHPAIVPAPAHVVYLAQTLVSELESLRGAGLVATVGALRIVREALLHPPPGSAVTVPHDPDAAAPAVSRVRGAGWLVGGRVRVEAAGVSYSPADGAAAAATAAALAAAAADPAFIRGFVSFAENIERQAGSSGPSGLHTGRAVLFRLVFALGGPAVFDAWAPALGRLADPEHRVRRAFSIAAAEILIGALLAALDRPDLVPAVRTWASAHLVPVLTALTFESLVDWRAGLVQVLGWGTPEEAGWLAELLLAVGAQAETPAERTKALALRTTVAAGLSWRGQRLWPQLLQGEPSDCQMDQVRQATGWLVGAIAEAWAEPGRDASGRPTLAAEPRDCEPLTRAVGEVAAALSAAEAALAAIADTSRSDRLEPQQAVSRLRLLLLGVLFNGARSGSAAVVRLVAVHLAALLRCADDADELVGAGLKGLLQLAARGRLTAELMLALLTALEDARPRLGLRAALVALEFLQPLLAAGMFLCRCDAGTEAATCAAVTALLAAFLADKEIAVRELAALTLAGALECFRLDRAALVQRFVKAAKPKRKSAADAAAGLAARHAGTLGLMAVLRTRPYDIESWMPELLELLARCATGDESAVGKSIKAFYRDFWRTHGETLAHQRHLFSDSQYEAVRSLLTSPSYYA